MDTKNNQIVYQAKVGAFGEVAFWKDYESNVYSFSFFNGAEYTPLNLSADAAYYVWAFIACEHPDCSTVNFTPVKKADRSKQTKKRPSLTKKKKAKN